MILKSHIMGNSCNLKSACVLLISVFSLCHLVSQKSRLTQVTGNSRNFLWAVVMHLCLYKILPLQNEIYLFLNITLFIVQYYCRNKSIKIPTTYKIPKLLSIFPGTPDMHLQNPWVPRKSLWKTLLYRVIISSNIYSLSLPFASFIMLTQPTRPTTHTQW